MLSVDQQPAEARAGAQLGRVGRCERLPQADLSASVSDRLLEGVQWKRTEIEPSGS
jgi:hypothetical protein